ncbi:hypothetical protein [Rhizohabitans arisaemae]|uniref:hypothetical protein n=1 Tax=Rhizohabitans arisaemae TaxID=2720610 RepID=UPI0024B15961|nr:hypothetical protein [Rhizohabitans arisaemae]
MRPGRRFGAFDAVVSAAGLLLVLLAVPGIAPARAAAFADGLPGVFTAHRVECVRHPGHESCSWLGEFRSDDGAVRRATVAFYGSDRDMFTEGRQTRAFDTGRRGHVYGPGGSREWIAVALLLLAGLLLTARPLLRRRHPGRARVSVAGTGDG